jgi:hypothetical protein
MNFDRISTLILSASCRKRIGMLAIITKIGAVLSDNIDEAAKSIKMPFNL